MSRLYDALEALIADVDHWFISTSSDGGVIVHVDEQPKIVFRNGEHFREFHGKLMDVKDAMEEPAHRQGAKIEVGFQEFYDDILEYEGEWIVKRGLDKSQARSLKRQLRIANEDIGVSIRSDGEGGQVVYARLKPTLSR